MNEVVAIGEAVYSNISTFASPVSLRLELPFFFFTLKNTGLALQNGEATHAVARVRVKIKYPSVRGRASRTRD